MKINRRHFLAGSAAALLTTPIRGSWATNEPLRSHLPLWRDTPPGGGGPAGDEVLSAGGALRNISHPALEVFTPTNPNGWGILVAGGGGYKHIEMGDEAWPAAQWLAALGYTAFVLSYRLPGEGWGAGSLVALQDAQRALRMIRHRQQHVGVLGFSAGGHLLGMAITRTDFKSYPAVDSLDDAPAYAEHAALIYPVITLEKPYTHTSTHKILVGPHADPTAEAAWSVQHFVTSATPPVFMAQAKDDTISDPHNTLIMAAACQRHHVPVEMHRYSHGGHAFGMGKAGTPTVKWPASYREWLATVQERAASRNSVKTKEA